MEGKKYYKNYSYLIEQDKFTENPDQWSDDLFLVYDHRNFCIERDGFYPTEINDYLNGDDDYDFSDYWIFPIYAYIHSGVSLSLTHNGDKWDTSMQGYMLANKKEFISEKQAKENVEILLKMWNTYLSGEVYNLKIFEFEKCPHCGHIEENPIEYMAEIYGYDEAERLAKEYIDDFIKSYE